MPEYYWIHRREMSLAWNLDNPTKSQFNVSTGSAIGCGPGVQPTRLTV